MLATAVEIQTGLLPRLDAALQMLDAAVETTLVKGLSHRFGLTIAGADQDQVVVGMLPAEQAPSRDVVATGDPGPMELASLPHIDHQRRMVICNPCQLALQIVGGK